jgi:hypothetical protein
VAAPVHEDCSFAMGRHATAHPPAVAHARCRQRHQERAAQRWGRR